MTGKERAEFRKQANSLSPIFQIGKGEISDNLLDAVEAALDKKELIKMTVLENSGLSAKDAAEMISAAIGADVIQCIGRKFVLYRKKPETAK